MEMDKIMQHWKSWAEEYKTDLRATTKTRTIKELEISALYRAFKRTRFFDSGPCRVLEVGCGNGYNCFRLSELLPSFSFTGVDIIPEMVEHALAIKGSRPECKSLAFFQSDVLALDSCPHLEDRYDILFTDRCLINLNTHELQERAIDQIFAKTVPGGYIVIIENEARTHARQNVLREAVGLSARVPDQYNLFLDEERFLSYTCRNLKLIDAQCFASLHDIVLYVLVPMLNDGAVDYDSPFIRATTELLLSLPEEYTDSFGEFGQNRLYFFQKEPVSEI